VQQFIQYGQVAGIDIDRDVIMADALGGLPSWAINQPTLAIDAI
jgi:hypothetical protein